MRLSPAGLGCCKGDTDTDTNTGIIYNVDTDSWVGDLRYCIIKFQFNNKRSLKSFSIKIFKPL